MNDMGDSEQEWRQAMFDQGERQIHQLDHIRRAVQKLWNVVATLTLLWLIGVVLFAINVFHQATQ